MSDTSPPPLAPGEFFDSSAGHDGEQFEGREFTFADINESTGAIRTNGTVVRRLVKNSSGITLLGKRIVVLNAAGTEIEGYGRLGTAAAGPEHGYPLDEYLASTGLANGDWGYIVVSGSAICTKTGVAHATGSVTVDGSKLQVATAAASTAASTDLLAGRVDVSAGATSVKALELLASVGSAMSAQSSHATDTDILVNIGNSGKSKGKGLL
jgi:hypothetical protein